MFCAEVHYPVKSKPPVPTVRMTKYFLWRAPKPLIHPVMQLGSSSSSTVSLARTSHHPPTNEPIQEKPRQTLTMVACVSYESSDPLLAKSHLEPC